jgi:hypothetical protein
LRTIQHPFVVVDDIAGPELPGIVADVDFDADGRVLYLAQADDHFELFRDHRPTGTRCDIAPTGPHRTPSGLVWFVAAQPDGSCSMVVDGSEQWSSARASLRDFAVFEMSVQESPDGRRFGYLVGNAGFTDGGEVHLVLYGVKLDMLVDDRWWTRSPGFSPDGRWAAIGVRAEGFSQDDRSRRVRTYPNGAPVGGMRPWVEGQPLGPLADQWAGPWWTATSVRFVGLRGDTLVRAQLSLPGGEAADVSWSNSGG